MLRWTKKGKYLPSVPIVIKLSRKDRTIEISSRLKPCASLWRNPKVDIAGFKFDRPIMHFDNITLVEVDEEPSRTEFVARLSKV